MIGVDVRNRSPDVGFPGLKTWKESLLVRLNCWFRCTNVKPTTIMTGMYMVKDRRTTFVSSTKTYKFINRIPRRNHFRYKTKKTSTNGILLTN